MTNRPDLTKLQCVYLYRDVMTLIKIRQDSSEYFQKWLQSTKFENIPGGMGIEFLYLQLRMICESIAMACLIAHNDIHETKSKKFFNNWNAEDTLKQLEKIHKNFYPNPAKQIIDKDGKVIGVSTIENGYLTKDKFLTLYKVCSDYLHIGSLKKNLRPMETGPVSVDPIIEWHNEIKALLNCHWIPLADGKGQLWTIMNLNNTNKVRVDLYLDGSPAPFVK
jgi:hypothetical protein